MKTYCGAIFCEMYDKKFLFDKPAFAKKTFVKVCGLLLGPAPESYQFKDEPCSLPARS